MRAAPPVSVRADGGVPWRTVRVLLPALAAGALVQWTAGHLEWSGFAAPAAMGVAAALAAWRTRRGAERSIDLCWDGHQWLADGAAGRLDVMLDLQSWLLLRLRPSEPGPARWIAVAAAEAGAQWPLLRAAVHSASASDPPALGSA